MRLYLLFYRFFLFLYSSFICLFSFFNPKAKHWVEGRKRWKKKLRNQIPKNVQPIWIHCASLGEFEQARPLIEKIKENRPQDFILLSFFSPSGYEIRKTYPLADAVLYLPNDSPHNARHWVALTRPKLVIWIKYEFWFFYLQHLHREGIPTYLVSAIFNENHFFFKPYGKFHRRCLHFFSHIFVQNEVSCHLLAKVGITNTTAAGDTRLDRVQKIASEAPAFPLVEAFLEADHRPILIAGSTWQPDETFLINYLKTFEIPPFRCIFAPHDISQTRIKSILQQLPFRTIRYSEATLETAGQADVLLVDNIGMLAYLYQYGDVAYIGGAFGKGLHNTLEPIVFGLPVVFGKKYQKFEEAIFLIENGGGFSVRNAHELQTTLNQLLDQSAREKASTIARRYIYLFCGATERINSVLKLWDDTDSNYIIP